GRDATRNPRRKRRRRPRGRLHPVPETPTLASGGLSGTRRGVGTGRGAIRRIRGEGADRLLHLGGQRRELLRACLALLAQLRAQLRLLLQQLRNGLRTECRTHAERRTGVGDACLENVTGHGILETRKALERPEAFLLGLGEGRKGALVAVQPAV